MKPAPPFTVCVYCGARDGRDPAYAAAAEDVGRLLSARGWRLVYGAGDVGLMGRVAAAHAAGQGSAMGVIPRHLLGAERNGRAGGDVVVTETMHERKKVMLMNADAVLLLPGGAGSMDELFEALTWRQLGLHDKPILVLDVAGYWTPLLALIRHVVDHGFADRTLLDYVRPVDGIDTLEAALSDAASGRGL